MKLEQNSALLVIDIQQADFPEMTRENINDSAWDCIRNAKRVLDVFRAGKLPVIQIKEVHRPDMVDFGREPDGSEGVHCLEDLPETDYANLTCPKEGDCLISKRRHSAFFGTDPEILLKGAPRGSTLPGRRADRRLHPLHSSRRPSARLSHPGGDRCRGRFQRRGPPLCAECHSVSPAGRLGYSS